MNRVAPIAHEKMNAKELTSLRNLENYQIIYLVTVKQQSNHRKHFFFSNEETVIGVLKLEIV